MNNIQFILNKEILSFGWGFFIFGGIKILTTTLSPTEFMRKLINILFLLIITQTCFSQDLIGKWYMVNRSGLIEMVITKDSISTRKIFSDFRPKDERKERLSLVKIEKLDDRILLIYKSKKDTLKFSAITLINYSENKHFQQAWNGHDTITDKIETLIELNKSVDKKLFGYNFYSEKYIDTLKKLKPIEDMSLSDFESYLKLYLSKLKETELEFSKKPAGYMTGFSHNFQIISQSFFESGYNPIQNTRTVNPLFQKYYKKPN